MTTRLRGRADEGAALLVVTSGMLVVSLFLLASLAFALNSMAPARRDQDAKSALAAAQAGVDEYLSRLNANDTYWRNGNADASNPALTADVPVAGSGQTGETYRYTVLSTAVETAQTGFVRLQVTGRSRGIRRDLQARLSPSGFVKYVYFTDLETTDPALYAGAVRASWDGTDTWGSGAGSNIPAAAVTGAASGVSYYKSFYADPATVTAQCSSYWYAGRSAPGYTSGAVTAIPYTRQADGSYAAGSRVAVQAGGHSVGFTCAEIQFTGGDKLTGPVKTNDAFLLSGSPWFTQGVYSGWPVGSSPAPPSSPGPWRGSGVPDPQGFAPAYQAPLAMPSSNSDLLAAAGSGVGCVYSGATSIAFTSSGTMSVYSPGTTTSSSRCYNATVNAAQTFPVPQVIYVQEAPACGSGSVGYPRSGESTSVGPTADYDCHRGNAYVSGTLSGQVTIGTANDVVVVGDTTYKDGMTGSDVLGLVPQNYCWIYHPVKSDGSNLLGTPVRKLDAAVLSVGHSFLVENYNAGAALSTSGDTTTALQVRGAIAQKYRGPVGTGTATAPASGYLKGYLYDSRLNAAPPPYFLRPLATPWQVSRVTG